MDYSATMFAILSIFMDMLIRIRIAPLSSIKVIKLYQITTLYAEEKRFTSHKITQILGCLYTLLQSRTLLSQKQYTIDSSLALYARKVQRARHSFRPLKPDGVQLNWSAEHCYSTCRMHTSSTQSVCAVVTRSRKYQNSPLLKKGKMYIVGIAQMNCE